MLTGRHSIHQKAFTRQHSPPEQVLAKHEHEVPVLQKRRSKRYNLGIIFHFTPLKHILRPIIRTV